MPSLELNKNCCSSWKIHLPLAHTHTYTYTQIQLLFGQPNVTFQIQNLLNKNRLIYKVLYKYLSRRKKKPRRSIAVLSVHVINTTFENSKFLESLIPIS